ncbi:hypothetical protein Tco_1008613 [Tanacetum coccineum]
MHLMQSTVNDPEINKINGPGQQSNKSLNAINERGPYFKETPSIRHIECIEYDHCEPTVSSLNDNEIDFRISFDESDDEDYTVVYDENSFFYKIISVNNLKTDFENNNEKVNMPSFPLPEPEVSYFNDLYFFNDFENKFPAIVYNDALTSKSDLLTEPTISLRHIDEFDLKDETSLFECDEEEQNILYFNDLLPFNVIYPGDLKSDTDNDNDKIDIKQPSGDINYGVNYEEKAKRRNSGAKMKTFKENCYLLPYAVSRKKDTAYQRQLSTR